MADERPFHVLMTADCVGGVWTHALELAAALGRLGGRVTLASMGAPLTPAQRAQAAGIPALSLHESTWRLEWMDDPWDDVAAAGHWLQQLEQSLRPDVVHLNQFAFGALRFRAPTLVVAHSCVLSWWRAVRGGSAPASFDRYRRAVAAGLAGAGLVAAPTHAMLASLAENHGLARPGLVLPNGRDPLAYRPAAKQPVVLSAGRLWDEAKNLAALEAVAAELPWPVRVAGATRSPGGGMRETHAVEPLGELSPSALAVQMSQAAIYALPARYEPFGQSALEAALSGCALVLGDIGSLRELWGPAALYVPPDDHGALRDALLRLIAQPSLRDRLARSARARALRFTPARMAHAYRRAYRQLIAHASPPPTPRLEEFSCAS
ncbi:glycosyltransferase, family [Variovorax sp. PBS-H4]|uniref:glycosyltransferase family 4 protein n=1 Tax=Variovorax sp. PBS-H4 TaxID=434008 RepID=UPI001315EF9A|nr:glycosyltransferase family 4 protein [Variovorax sp. PBS-H4]VTU41235.1 glycosyltransferase, family [Variovorax sp. PBS-H4]